MKFRKHVPGRLITYILPTDARGRISNLGKSQDYLMVIS